MMIYKTGDKLRYVFDSGRFFTNGEVYEIKGAYDRGFNVIDDEGDLYGWSYDDIGVDFELVPEPTEPTPVEASPTVIELLANISRRLYEVEESLKPSEPSGATTQDDTVDNVNSPQHYRHGRFETIEIIEDITKKYDDGFVAYCVGNAVKYIDRAPFKHGSPAEDLRKAAWYLTRAADYTTPSTGK